MVGGVELEIDPALFDISCCVLIVILSRYDHSDKQCIIWSYETIPTQSHNPPNKHHHRYLSIGGSAVELLTNGTVHSSLSTSCDNQICTQTCVILHARASDLYSFRPLHQLACIYHRNQLHRYQSSHPFSLEQYCCDSTFTSTINHSLSQTKPSRRHVIPFPRKSSRL